MRAMQSLHHLASLEIFKADSTRVFLLLLRLGGRCLLLLILKARNRINDILDLFRRPYRLPIGIDLFTFFVVLFVTIAVVLVLLILLILLCTHRYPIQIYLLVVATWGKLITRLVSSGLLETTTDVNVDSRLILQLWEDALHIAHDSLDVDLLLLWLLALIAAHSVLICGHVS